MRPSHNTSIIHKLPESFDGALQIVKTLMSSSSQPAGPGMKFTAQCVVFSFDGHFSGESLSAVRFYYLAAFTIDPS